MKLPMFFFKVEYQIINTYCFNFYFSLPLTRLAISVRNHIRSVPHFRSRTAFVTSSFPWVARSEYLLSIDMALVWDRLPRVIQV